MSSLFSGALSSWHQAAAIAAPASPTPTPVQVDGGPKDDDDPAPWDVGGRMKKAINEWIKDMVTSALHPVFDAMAKAAFTTPHVDEHSRVRELWRFSFAIAFAGLIVMVLAGAGVVTISDELAPQLTVREMLPRLVFGAGMTSLSLFLVAQMVDISNALSESFIDAGSDPDALTKRISEAIFGGIEANMFMAFVALGLVILGVLVLIGYIFRVVVLVLLSVAAPLMLMSYSLPQTDALCRYWWRAVLATLAAPVAQALLLATALRVFLSQDGTLGISGGLIDLLVLGALFWMMFKLPFWAIKAASNGASSRVAATVRRQAKSAAKAAMAA